MFKNSLKISESFTIIELLITVIIIIIFSGLSIAYYNQFTQEKKLESETKKLVDILEIARKKSSAGDLSGYSCTEFSGYQVVVSSSSPNYALKLCCSSNCSSPPGQTITTYDFSTGMSVVSGASFRFQPLSSSTSTTITVQIKNTSTNKCIPISVSPAGIIEEGAKVGC